MLDKDIYFDDYETIEKKDYSLEYKVEYNPYEEIDEICDKLNRIKCSMLEQASMAGMTCVVESSEERPIIGTQALDTCYGILFYDRQARYGVVGHGAPSSKVGTLYEMLRLIDDGTDKVVEFMIVPGFRNVDYKDLSGQQELLEEMMKYSRDSKVKFVPLKGDIQIKLHEPTLSYEFAFDTRNCKFVSDTIFFDETEVNPRYMPKSNGRYGK